MKFKTDNVFSLVWTELYSFLCLTSGNSGSDCVNRSVADRGSRAMIGLRICAFSSDFKVTKIYNQMAYDTLVKATHSWRQEKKPSQATLDGSAWPHAVDHYWDVLLSVFITTPNKDMHVSLCRQKVVKDGIWGMDLIDRQYMVHTV